MLSQDEDAGVPSASTIAYATRLIDGVQERIADLDALIVQYAERWALDRMPIVDKNVLRLALYELMAEPDVPVAVIINEAIELAKSLSTDESGRFINGILGRIAEADPRSAKG